MENLKIFLEIVSGDETLRTKLTQADSMGRDEVIKVAIALAAERGITLTEADFGEAPKSGAISDDEMAAVVGGAECACMGIGGGKKGEHSETCACWGVGQGNSSDGYKGEKIFDGYIDRCLCVAGGFGHDE